MKTLLEKISEAPKYEGNNWAKYKQPYFTLVDEKNYPNKAAIQFIADEEGLSKADFTKLYNASKSWKRD